MLRTISRGDRNNDKPACTKVHVRTQSSTRMKCRSPSKRKRQDVPLRVISYPWLAKTKFSQQHIFQIFGFITKGTSRAVIFFSFFCVLSSLFHHSLLWHCYLPHSLLRPHFSHHRLMWYSLEVSKVCGTVLIGFTSDFAKLYQFSPDGNEHYLIQNLTIIEDPVSFVD